MSAIRRSRVDLPQPLGPMSAPNSPFAQRHVHVFERNDELLAELELLGGVVDDEVVHDGYAWWGRRCSPAR